LLPTTLVERAPQLRRGGYIIDFWGLGYDLSERMGLLEQVKAAGYQIEEVRLVDGRGRRTAFSVPGYAPRDEDTYVSHAVPGKTISRLSMRDDRTMFLLVRKDARGPSISDPEAQRAYLR
jgi:2-polyprenyl-6-methoxyphenol hydroxylase-like FAD-dependent oxidoreductase